MGVTCAVEKRLLFEVMESKLCFPWLPHGPFVFSRFPTSASASLFLGATESRIFSLLFPPLRGNSAFTELNGNLWVRMMFRFVCSATVEFMWPCLSSVKVSFVLWFSLQWHLLNWRRPVGENKLTTEVLNNGLGNTRCACLRSTSLSVS